MEDRTERKIESQEVSAGEVILSVKDLTTHYITREIGTCEAVRNVSFEICRGETLGLVGETGAGKSIVIDAISAVLGERTSPPKSSAERSCGRAGMCGRSATERCGRSVEARSPWSFKTP